MLQELPDESVNRGLKMKKSKTNVMMENDTPIYVNNTQFENVESYIYLGQRYSTRGKNQDKGIQRRTMAGWTAFAKHRDIFKGHIGICLKRQVYNPSMLNITYRDRKINGYKSKRRQIQNDDNQNGDNHNGDKYKTATDQNSDTPKRRHTKTATIKTATHPKRRHAKKATHPKGDTPKRRHIQNGDNQDGDNQNGICRRFGVSPFLDTIGCAFLLVARYPLRYQAQMLIYINIECFPIMSNYVYNNCIIIHNHYMPQQFMHDNKK